jgi:hypothetical protein
MGEMDLPGGRVETNLRIEVQAWSWHPPAAKVQEILPREGPQANPVRAVQAREFLAGLAVVEQRDLPGAEFETNSRRVVLSLSPLRLAALAQGALREEGILANPRGEDQARKVFLGSAAQAQMALPGVGLEIVLEREDQTQTQPRRAVPAERLLPYERFQVNLSKAVQAR